MAQAADTVTMPSLSYIPGKPTLVLLFKAARVRLMTNSARADSLSDTRIVSATEEMNRISDDIRDAEVNGPSNHRIRHLSPSTHVITSPAIQRLEVPCARS